MLEIIATGGGILLFLYLAYRNSKNYESKNIIFFIGVFVMFVMIVESCRN